MCVPVHIMYLLIHAPCDTWHTLSFERRLALRLSHRTRRTDAAGDNMHSALACSQASALPVPARRACGRARAAAVVVRASTSREEDVYIGKERGRDCRVHARRIPPAWPLLVFP